MIIKIETSISYDSVYSEQFSSSSYSSLDLDLSPLLAGLRVESGGLGLDLEVSSAGAFQVHFLVTVHQYVNSIGLTVAEGLCQISSVVSCKITLTKCQILTFEMYQIQFCYALFQCPLGEVTALIRLHSWNGSCSNDRRVKGKERKIRVPHYLA